MAARRDAMIPGHDRAASAGGAPAPSARALLDSLRRIETDLAAERRFVRLAEDEIGKASREASSPASSPEEAEHTARYFRELRGTLGADLRAARERAARLERGRREILAGMDRSGSFGDRWVADGARAVYLRVDRDAGEEARYELLGAPWPAVKDAPPGDRPEETVRRGEILAAAVRREREVLVLAGVVVTAGCLGDLLLPDAWLLGAVLAAAVAGMAVFPATARYLIEWVFFRERALARSAEEAAARAHLDLVRRGVADRPPLETLVREAREGVVERYRQRLLLGERFAEPSGPGGRGGDPGTRVAEDASSRDPEGPEDGRAKDREESPDPDDEGRSG